VTLLHPLSGIVPTDKKPDKIKITIYYKQGNMRAEHIFLILVILFVIYVATKNILYAALILIVLAVSQYNNIYQSWIQVKETEAFEQKMGEVVKKINENESTAIATIPRIIIQVWVQKGGGIPKIPANQVNYMNKFRKMNPAFEHMFFNGEDVEEFFKSNYMEYYDTYQRLPFFIQTLDFFRYLAIYHYGGFYFDMDIDPKKPLDEKILNHSAVFPVDEYASKLDCANNPRMKSYCLVGQNFLLGQYAFGATAKHPFMKFMVDKIQQNLENYIRIAKQINKADKDATHYFVYKTTGPDFVTDCYVKYKEKEQLYILSNGKRQMFGDYAEHKYIGTWK
jgi:mannosyltransferase OCH1-like enzyme